MKQLIILVLLTVLSSQMKAQETEDSILTALQQRFELTKHDKPTVHIRFNTDTILIAGYLSDLSNTEVGYKTKKNSVYKTTDGGLNWKQIKFNGDAWIYDAFHRKDGKIWMGGSDNYIHYSNDFGETWSKKPKPFDPVNRVRSIFMEDSLNGIAGGLSNGLAITNDNWEHSQQIPSPIDQGKFKISTPSARDRIENIALVDSFIIINQNDYIFYSKKQPVNWKKFNIPVASFSMNPETSEIHLYSRNGKIFVLDKALNLIRETQETYPLQIVKRDSTKLNLDSFFKSEISTITITSTKWLFDKQVHMSSLYKPDTQIAKIKNKRGAFIFKAKGFDENHLNLSVETLQEVFQDKNFNIELSELSKHLAFKTNDLIDYKKHLESLKKEWAERAVWGGNFTSQIELTHPKFEDFKNQSNYIKEPYLTAVFKKVDAPLLLATGRVNFIEVRLRNKKGKELIIDTKNGSMYALPWNITYQNTSMETYNPKISAFVRTLLPPEFNNYESLLGGKLIYSLIQEEIIDHLKYEKRP